MAWNHGLSRAVLQVYTRGARARGVPGGRTGSVAIMQRAGSGLNVNLHTITIAQNVAHQARNIGDAEAQLLSCYSSPDRQTVDAT